MIAHDYGYEKVWEWTSVYKLEVGKKREIFVAKIDEPIDWHHAPINWLS